MKAERQRVIIAFADITDFGPWARRSEPEEFTILMSRIYEEFFRFQLENGCFLKLLSDGFLAIQHLRIRNDRKRIVRFLKAINECGIRINKIIKRQVLPRPKHFRIRVVVGTVWKVSLKGGAEDYLGYQVNYCSRLLDALKEEVILVSDSVFDAVGGNKNHNVGFRRLRIDGLSLSGVDFDDLKTIYALKFNRR